MNHFPFTPQMPCQHSPISLQETYKHVLQPTPKSEDTEQAKDQMDDQTSSEGYFEEHDVRKKQFKFILICVV